MINAAVVGLGTWGKTMVESLASGSDLMRLTTLQTRTVTPDVEAFAKQHSLAIAKSYQDVLADPKIDAVVLATPVSGHVQQIEAAAAAGKHVYCEKPFTFSRKEAEQALAALSKAKRVTGIGYNRRVDHSLVPRLFRLCYLGQFYLGQVSMASTTQASIQNTQYSMPPITQIHFLVTL